ncbi:unnamed protein product [Rhizophagus irregularis]|nr:unnamed protein product [Rhizophagus irregularis]
MLIISSDSNEENYDKMNLIDNLLNDIDDLQVPNQGVNMQNLRTNKSILDDYLISDKAAEDSAIYTFQFAGLHVSLPTIKYQKHWEYYTSLRKILCKSLPRYHDMT